MHDVKPMFPEIHDRLDECHGGIFDNVTYGIMDDEMKTADEGPKPYSQEELGSIYDNIIRRTYSDDQYEYGTSIDELVKLLQDVEMR